MHLSTTTVKSSGTRRYASHGSGGYLLLEVVLALGIAAGVLTGIFMIANGSLSLSDTIIREGRADARREAFLNFLERNFETLPGNARIELVTRDTGNRYLPTLTIQNAPASFSFAGLPISAQAIVLTTVPVPSGGVNVVIEYYEEPILDDEENIAVERPVPSASIIIFRDIWRFEIRALDVNSMEWLTEWESNRLPLQFEVNAVFDPQGEVVVHHLWIPPKVSPVTLMRTGGRTVRGGSQQQESSTDSQATP